MKNSVVVVAFSFLCLCTAEVQQLDQQEEGNSTVGPSLRSACPCAYDIADSVLLVTLRQLEAKLQNTEKEIEDLRAEVRGKNMH